MQELNQRWLEALKIYLPYVVITVLFYACIRLYNDNATLHEQGLREAQKQRDFWQDAFIQTNKAKNSLNGSHDDIVPSASNQ